jgi:hypothetical protein
MKNLYKIIQRKIETLRKTWSDQQEPARFEGLPYKDDRFSRLFLLFIHQVFKMDITRRILRNLNLKNGFVIDEESYRELFKFYYRNLFSHKECYITCSGKKDGAGAQAQAIMSTMLFAEIMHIKYIHTPLDKVQHNYANDHDWENKWENFFNMGKDELSINDVHQKISREIYLYENPLRIKKMANTLFVLRHCHEFADIFPNKYTRIKNRLVEKYYASPKSAFVLHQDAGSVNIAVHIRRGDVSGNNEFKDKFTENRFIVDVLNNILKFLNSQGIESSIFVYSEGEKEDFKELERPNLKFFLNDDPFTTFHNLVCADVLVMSKSTFSYTAALLSKGIVFYESFRHKPLNGWIRVDGNARFNSKILLKKLNATNPHS